MATGEDGGWEAGQGPYLGERRLQGRVLPGRGCLQMARRNTRVAGGRGEPGCGQGTAGPLGALPRLLLASRGLPSLGAQGPNKMGEVRT